MSSRRAVFAVLLAVVAGLTAAPVGASAAAQEGCGNGGGLTGTVRIDSPADGAVVSGVVEVRGSATAGLPLGELDRVDVTLGGITKSASYEGQSPLPFSVSIDTSNIAPGEKSLIVVACGTSLGGVLARGVAEIAVEVERPGARPTTSVAQPTTTAGRQGAAGAATTTSVASSAAAAAVAAGGTTTTATSAPTTTAAQSEARAPAAARPEPVRPRAGPDAPLVLTETPDRGSSGPPLWVGAVVGISGGLGLLFSAASWRRRTHAPIEAEHIDPDLVDVR